VGRRAAAQGRGARAGVGGGDLGVCEVTAVNFDFVYLYELQASSSPPSAWSKHRRRPPAGACSRVPAAGCRAVPRPSPKEAAGAGEVAVAGN